MAKPTIIVVDDDHAFVDALALYLDKHGYRTRTGFNGRDGRELLADEDAAVAVVDVHLPDANGIDLVEGLHHRAGCPAVILISADDSAETAERCKTCGATCFLVKPVAPRELLEIIHASVKPPS